MRWAARAATAWLPQGPPCLPPAVAPLPLLIELVNVHTMQLATGLPLWLRLTRPLPLSSRQTLPLPLSLRRMHPHLLRLLPRLFR